MKSVKITRRSMLILGASSLAGALLAACGATPTAAPAGGEAEATSAPPTPAGSKEPVHVTYMMWSNGPIGDENEKKRVDLFNQSQSDVVCEPIIIPWGDMFTKLKVQGASGGMPDTVGYDFPMDAMIFEGWFKDVRPYAEMVPAFFDDAQYDQNYWKPAQEFGDKQLFQMPNGANVTLLYYNKDLLEAGSASAPTDDFTWDDFLTVAKATTKSDGDKAYGASLAWLKHWIIMPSLLLAYGGDIVDSHQKPTKCTLDSPEATERIQFLQDLIYDYKVAPNPAESEVLSEQGGEFASGRLALYVSGDWDISFFQGLDRFGWDIALVPKGPKGRSSPMWSVGISLSSQSKNPDAAWAWLRWTCEKEGQDMWAATGYAVPWLRNSRSITPTITVPDGYQKRIQAFENVHIAHIFHPDWQEVLDKVWSPEFDKLWLEQESARELVANTCPKINEYLQA